MSVSGKFHFRVPTYWIWFSKNYCQCSRNKPEFIIHIFFTSEQIFEGYSKGKALREGSRFLQTVSMVSAMNTKTATRGPKNRLDSEVVLNCNFIIILCVHHNIVECRGTFVHDTTKKDFTTSPQNLNSVYNSYKFKIPARAPHSLLTGAAEILIFVVSRVLLQSFYFAWCGETVHWAMYLSWI